MANLRWTKDSFLRAAIRDFAWDAANTPRKAQKIEGVLAA